MIREFDPNHFTSTDLNQLYASDFDFKMTIVWLVMLKAKLIISIFQHWSDVDVFFCCVVGIVIHKITCRQYWS